MPPSASCSTFADPRFAARDPHCRRSIVAAGADPVCATPAIERFAARLKAGHAIVIPGARHEILMERDAIREQFWAAFDAFIPGTPDADRRMLMAAAGLAAEELEGGGVDAAVAGGDDEPPSAAEPPSQVVTMPPAPSMIGIRATMS